MRQIITEDLEEPKESGIYIITDRTQQVMHVIYRTYVCWNEGFCRYHSWEEILRVYSGVIFYIESLADRDARIREEAWDEGKEAESEYWNYLSEAGGDTELMFEPEEPTNPYLTEES